MAHTRVLILSGSTGFAFFWQEALLEKGLADQVDLVSRVEEGIDLFGQSAAYDLVVINLLDAWQEGIQLGLWLSQQTDSCPVILVMGVEQVNALPSDHRFLVLPAPLSLSAFIKCVRAVLEK